MPALTGGSASPPAVFPATGCSAILAGMPDPQAGLVELTRRSMMDTNAGDFGAAIGVFADAAVFDVSEAGIGRFEGREAVRAYLEDWIGAFERQEFTSWEGTDLGAGVVFVVAVLEGKPAGSDAHVRNPRTMGLPGALAGGVDRRGGRRPGRRGRARWRPRSRRRGRRAVSAQDPVPAAGLAA